MLSRRVCRRLFMGALVMGGVSAALPVSAAVLSEISKSGVDLRVVLEDPEPSSPAGRTLPVDVATHHVEVIARFAKGNPYGGAPGSFFPYLKIRAVFVHEADGRVVQARLHPLAHGHDPGFHYGANVRLPTKGRYRVVVSVDPPSDEDLGRHEDVKGWFEPILMKLDYTWK